MLNCAIKSHDQFYSFLSLFIHWILQNLFFDFIILLRINDELDKLKKKHKCLFFEIFETTQLNLNIIKLHL